MTETTLKDNILNNEAKIELRDVLTVFVLVPNLHQPIALSRRCEKRPVWAKRHVMDGRGCVALPNTLPSLVLRFFLLVRRSPWVTFTSDFKFH